jgi:hypothetical protein
MKLISYIYLSSILFAILSGFSSFKILDKASKIFLVYVGSAFLSECAADYYSFLRRESDFPVYAIYNIAELVFFALYFNYSIDLFKKLHIGVYIAGAGTILGACNIIFVEGLNSMNANFMFFEGFCIIGMCLFALTRLLIYQQRLNLLRYPHFYIITIVLFYQTITFIYWGLYEVFLVKFSSHVMMILNESIIILNILFYLLIGLIFLLYKRMRLADD